MVKDLSFTYFCIATGLYFSCGFDKQLEVCECYLVLYLYIVYCQSFAPMWHLSLLASLPSLFTSRSCWFCMMSVNVIIFLRRMITVRAKYFSWSWLSCWCLEVLPLKESRCNSWHVHGRYNSVMQTTFQY